MENVPPMTASSRALRGAALLTAATLALTACGGGDDDADEPTTESSSAEPTPSTTVEVPEGKEITAPGTQLAFGDTATVAYELEDQGTVLALRVDSAVQGSIEDFE